MELEQERLCSQQVLPGAGRRSSCSRVSGNAWQQPCDAHCSSFFYHPPSPPPRMYDRTWPAEHTPWFRLRRMAAQVQHVPL